jgi:uncharacterized protein
MSERKFHLHNGKSGAAITVRVTPRASKNEISEILDDGTVKIRLTTPPEEAVSNQALLLFLADVLGVKTSQIEIVAGINGKDKLVAVTNMDSSMLQTKILQKLS